jgi:hypothetical protein
MQNGDRIMADARDTARSFSKTRSKSNRVRDSWQADTGAAGAGPMGPGVPLGYFG